MNNMYINIDVNDGSEKFTEKKTLRLSNYLDPMVLTANVTWSLLIYYLDKINKLNAQFDTLALISQSQLSASFIFVTNNWILIKFSSRVNVICAVAVQLVCQNVTQCEGEQLP